MLMGPLMQNMMIAAFETLKLARQMRKDLEMVVVMDVGNTDMVKTGLDLLCERNVEFAAQWRATIDSTWDPLRADPHFIELLERVGLSQST